MILYHYFFNIYHYFFNNSTKNRVVFFGDVTILTNKVIKLFFVIFVVIVSCFPIVIVNILV